MFVEKTEVGNLIMLSAINLDKKIRQKDTKNHQKPIAIKILTIYLN